MLLFGQNQIKSATLKYYSRPPVCLYEIHIFAMKLSSLYNSSFVSD